MNPWDEQDLIDMDAEIVQDVTSRPTNMDDVAPQPPTPFSIKGRAAFERSQQRMATLKKKDALRKATEALHEYSKITKQLEDYQARALKIWGKKIVTRLDTPIKPLDPHSLQRYKYLRYMVIREVTLENPEYFNKLKKDAENRLLKLYPPCLLQGKEKLVTPGNLAKKLSMTRTSTLRRSLFLGKRTTLLARPRNRKLIIFKLLARNRPR
jgi:hypothetical protein